MGREPKKNTNPMEFDNLPRRNDRRRDDFHHQLICHRPAAEQKERRKWRFGFEPGGLAQGAHACCYH
jgi:hypothetical protein